MCGTSDTHQLQLIFEMLGSPTPEKWEGYEDLEKLKSGEVKIPNIRKGKLRDKYSAKISHTALNLIEKLLAVSYTHLTLPTTPYV